MSKLGVVLFVLVVALSYSSATTITHSYNMASHLPSHLAIMFSMSWFGIPSSDPQGAGEDPSWGNWKWGGGDIPTSNPAVCNEGTSFTESFSDEERYIASKRRPLAGIYSASARDAKSLARVDLMLSSVKRSCDGGANARLDAWSVQQCSIHFTSKYGRSTICDIPYRALLAFYGQAQAAGMEGAVLPGMDTTWIFDFGSDEGVSSKTDQITILTQDIADMATIANSYGTTTRRINGLVVLVIYFDGTLSVSQWGTVLQNARNIAKIDFYAIGSAPGSVPTFFEVFDALSPWTDADYSLVNPTYAQALSWATSKHSTYVKDVKSFSGRVAVGSVIAGFDDYTEDWGNNKPRVMPRNTVLIEAATDYLKSAKLNITFMPTWDDWTEGTHFEPDTIDGTKMLVALKQGLGKLHGEAPDPTGDAALNARWVSYGKSRNCNGGKSATEPGGTAGTPPAITLSCGPKAGAGIGDSSEETTITNSTEDVFDSSAAANMTDSFDSSQEGNTSPSSELVSTAAVTVANVMILSLAFFFALWI